MELITFTEAERDLMDGLSVRQMQILRKLARILPVAENGVYSVSLSDFIGKGFDRDDADRIVRLVGKMDRIVREASIAGGFLHLRVSPEALTLLEKMAAQNRVNHAGGLGNAYGQATLALKMALGIKGDVDYSQEFDHENFNYGEDTGYLDRAFPSGCRWHMEFGDRPEDYLKRDVWISALANDELSITQSICCTWPDAPACWNERLGPVPVSVLTDPEKWERLLPEIAGKGLAGLKKARDEARAMLGVAQEDGSVVCKPDMLRDMRQACGEVDILCAFFGTDPEVRKVPEWPLRMEPKGWFREFSCSLAEFQDRFAPGLSQTFKWDVQRVAAELWLNIFREECGIAADPDDIVDFGEEGCAGDFREKYPAEAERIEPVYRKALEDARVRIAWGLATHNFRKIRAFVDGRISHPAIGTREIGRSGFEVSCGPGLIAMRGRLRDAERLALWNIQTLRERGDTHRDHPYNF